MSDDESDEVFTPEERIAALGFKPQREIVINNLLPYADKLDEESTRLFAEIKCNLGKAVMLREMKPGCGVWTSRLLKYLRIYGLKFSKEDHIALIKLVYELILIPDLEPSKIHKFATLFTMLTKKRFLLSPDDLTLPWRPLYDIAKKIFNKSATHIGMFHYLASLDNSFIGLVKGARPYFGPEATKEILAELMPRISPWSQDTQDVVGMFAMLLPMGLHPRYAAQGHELWFNDMMDLWQSCYNSQGGIADLVEIFASLAKRNPGAIDWTPYVPNMFARFLRAFNLPVSYKDTQPMRANTLEIKQIASWIVWTITPDGLVLKHLRGFLVGVESYLHSANSGRWSYKLRDLLRKLSKEFLYRVRREREKKFFKSWENQTPPSLRLTEDNITEFVKCVLEPALLAVHCRSGVADVSAALQHLATLRPDIVVPPLIERLQVSLESLTEPHRVTAAMQAVSSVARPMLRGASSGYPEGPTHVVPLLLASLPGLDPNDTRKTLVTLHFILIFTWMVPVIDCSSASEYWPDLTEEERLTCELTAQFEDFVLLFLDRLFTIIDSSILEHARLESREADSLRSKAESVVETGICATTTSVLMQCSPRIFGEALRKFKKFATETTFETNVAGSIIGVLLKVFARVNPTATLAAIVPCLTEELTEMLGTDEALHDENPPRELLYRLLLLSHAVECNGTTLLPYVPMLFPVLDRALKLHARDAYVRACDILLNTMASLSVVEMCELRSTGKDYSKAPQEWLPVREWGRGCALKEAQFSWHIPTAAEIECAQGLLDRYAVPEIARLQAWVNGERPICRKRRLRALFVLHSALGCTTLMPSVVESPVPLVETCVPATMFPLASAVDGALSLAGNNVRVEVSKIAQAIQNKLLEEKSDDTKSLEMLIQIWDRVCGVRPPRSGPSLEVRMRSTAVLERVLDGRGGPPGGCRLRTLLADAVKMQDEARIDLQSDAGIGPTGLKVLLGLFELSVNTYTTVRILAQMRLYWMLSHHAYSYRALVPRLSELLAAGGEGDEWHARHKGSLYVMLGPRAAPLIAKQDWAVARTLWPAVLKAPLSEKPSLVRLEQAFSDILHRQFPTVNTCLEMGTACVEAARAIMPQSVLDDAEFAMAVQNGEASEKEISEKNIRIYNELVEDLVAISEEPTVQWRRLEITMQMVSYCPNLQTPFPPSAVRLIVNSLIHDDIIVRRLSIKLTLFALKQRKRPHKKIKVDPYEIAGVSRPAKHVPGYRKDLEWAMWSETRVPQTDEEWERPYLRTPLVGFYSWHEQIEVSAPSYEQPSLDRKPEEMELGERHIYDFFNDDANVERLVGFLTVEEKKGKDKFNGFRFAMFTSLFRFFGDVFARKFLAHALKHASNSQEASQRFASEIVAAAIRAPKHWDRKRALTVYEEAMQVLKAGLISVLPEMTEDWGTCVASAVENLDPHRGELVIRELMELCAPVPADGADADANQESSFGVCARLYALQGALSALSWRGAPLAADLLKKLQDAHFIQHPYQNVRERVGSILMTIFDTELILPGGNVGPAPRVADFLADIRPKLAALYDEHGEIVVKTGVSSSGQCVCKSQHAASPEPELVAGGEAQVPVCVARFAAPAPVAETAHASEAEGGENNVIVPGRGERKLAARLETGLRLSGDVGAMANHREHARATNLLATVFRGSVGMIVRGVQGAVTEHYALLRMACALSARGLPQAHDELGRAADAFLASLALAQHCGASFDAALAAAEQVCEARSWWARLSCVDFAQALLFYGLPLLCENPERAVRAEAFALRLMRDQRLEVRQAAAKLLTGLMHCAALPDENKTVDKLMKCCRSKQLVERHCGVLGLCAYLSSRPYSLGPRIGSVLAELSRHTNAPDPVPSAIRSALADFRRTHQDDWPAHRAALTEEELDLLADLTSPPAYCA